MRAMTLGEYVTALIARLGEADPEALARMQRVVGRRRARIALDDEAIDVAFVPHGLDVQPATVDAPIDGEGATSRETVVALLDGRLEVTDAILQGYLRVTGTADDVSRMFVAIEILLDVSARAPALQALAETLRGAAPAVPATAVSPWEAQSREDEMLARLGLLAEDGGG